MFILTLGIQVFFFFYGIYTIGSFLSGPIQLIATYPQG